MSHVNLGSLTPRGLISQYVLECMGRGFFLPYEDYALIDEWLKLSPTTDDLLVLLSELLPDYFQKNKSGTSPRSLRGVNALVVDRLQQLHSRF